MFKLLPLSMLDDCEIDDALKATGMYGVEIETIIATIPVEMVRNDDGGYVIVNEFGEPIERFAHDDADCAMRRFDSYLTGAQRIALEINRRVNNDIANEGAANRLLSYTN